MIKVKVISSSFNKGLESAVNKFLTEPNDIENVVDVKLSIVPEADGGYFYTALVIYEEQDI